MFERELGFSTFITIMIFKKFSKHFIHSIKVSSLPQMYFTFGILKKGKSVPLKYMRLEQGQSYHFIGRGHGEEEGLIPYTKLTKNFLRKF